MKPVCILTDNTAQFLKPLIKGQDTIEIIPLIPTFNKIWDNCVDIDINQLPITAGDDLVPRMVPPTTDEFINIFYKLSKCYEKLIGIFLSSQLNSAFENAQKAVKLINGKIPIEIIDSQTTSIGLGHLVQFAASEAEKGTSAGVIERMIRIMVPHIYTVFCIPDLSYLCYAGYVDQAQAAISRMLGLYPIFALENGRLIPLEKVRNIRQASNYFLEFLEEFDNLNLISFLHPHPPVPQETLLLQEYIQTNHLKTHFTEQEINLSVATLLGPNSFGLFIIENHNQKFL